MMTRNTRRFEEGVPLGLLRRYLLAQGWQPIDADVKPSNIPELSSAPYADYFLKQRGGGLQGVEVFALSEKGLDDVEVILPRDLTSSDSNRRLQDVIETLAQLYEREPEIIAADVRAIGFDIVRSNIPDELVREDTINLEQANSYITGVKTLLAAAATTELLPDPYFLRLRKEASSYAEQCRFGHTFRGSFGFIIESPVTPNIQPTLPETEQAPPFERRVIQRLARGVRNVRDAVRLEDPGLIVKNVRSGFNANVCEQFAELIEKTAHSGMKFDFTFTPDWPTAEEFQSEKTFVVGPAHVEISRIAAKLMRDQTTPSRSEEIFGRIVRLQNQADPTDLLDQTGDREVVVQWSSEDLGDIQVRTSLLPADYLAAVEAHRNGKSIKMRGTLERQGRRWTLVAPTGFSVPEQTNPA